MKRKIVYVGDAPLCVPPVIAGLTRVDENETRIIFSHFYALKAERKNLGYDLYYHCAIMLYVAGGVADFYAAQAPQGASRSKLSWHRDTAQATNP